MKGGSARLTYPDLAEVLQARIFADLAAEKLAPMPWNRPDLYEHRRLGRWKPISLCWRNPSPSPKRLASGGSGKPRRGQAGQGLDAHIAVLEEAVAKAKALGGQRRQETETAAKRGETLASYIAMLEEAAAKAEALGEQRRRKRTGPRGSRPWKPIMLCWRKPSPRPKYRASSSARKPRQRPSGPTISLPNSSR